jgi:hypothetical protein
MKDYKEQFMKSNQDEFNRFKKEHKRRTYHLH